MKAYALVVQLDHLLLERSSAAAEAEGFEVIAARSGEEALDVLKDRGAPGLVITDLSLPKLDGFGLVRELRKRARLDETPAIALSAFRALREAALKRLGEFGFSEVLSSHATLETLRRAIRRAVSGSPSRATGEDDATIERAAERRESTRLRRIERMGLDQGLPQDPTFQRIAEEAAKALEAPIGIVTVALQDRMWFKAHFGFQTILAEEPQAARDWPFCRHVVEAGEELVVPDAKDHPVFGANPLVKDGQVRGYAGAPLVAPGGESVGTLCVASPHPLSVGPDQVDALCAIARRAAGELEIRAAARRAPEEADQLGSALGAEQGPATLMATLAMTRTALEGLESGVIVMDSSRRIVYANESAAAMLGLPAAKLTGMSRDRAVEHCCGLVEDAVEFMRKVRVSPGGPYVARAEFEFLHPVRRNLRWVSRPVQLPSGLGQLTLLTDITAEATLADERDRFAVTDPLTGLLNRRGGAEAVAREVSRARRTGEAISFILFDVDGLKHVNRRKGYESGDRLLWDASRALRDAARTSDLVARWGGEEFLMVLPACKSDEARNVAERAVSGLDSPDLEDLPGVSISAGVVELRGEERAEDAIGRAEGQLAAAKITGGGKVA